MKKQSGINQSDRNIVEANQMLNVLILDDEKSFTEELQEFLRNNGFNAIEANSASQGRAVLDAQRIDLLILDIRINDVNGLDILKEVKRKYPGMEVIIVSGHGDMDTVIKAMQLGAIDYLRKPFRHLDIRMAIERTQKFIYLQQRLQQMEEKNSLISKNLEQKIERNFIGISKKIKEVLETAMTAAKFAGTNVLITGESGTGKENIARIIHFESSRKDNIFWTVNSSAITETLIESEFFGHIKGSFTGAISDKKGFFEICNNGTLFLDEIADMPMNLQAKILRAIEDKYITRVGDTNKHATDFRIISATNHRLDDLVEEKKFRLDLLHRLNTLHIHVPPLREHPDDIEPLLLFFVQEYSVRFNKPIPMIDREIIDHLLIYDFPGNIRELKNLAERAIILSKGNSLSVSDFPLNTSRSSAKTKDEDGLSLKQNEIGLIRKSLKNHDYNQKAAANELGISRDALIRKMRKYDIHVIRKEE